MMAWAGKKMPGRRLIAGDVPVPNAASLEHLKPVGFRPFAALGAPPSTSSRASRAWLAIPTASGASWAGEA
jgi:hypothetical protein